MASEGDWLAQVRMRYEKARISSSVETIIDTAEDVPRLLACAEVLRKLVALHPDPRQRSDFEEVRLAWRREYAVAWERARRKLAGMEPE